MGNLFLDNAWAHHSYSLENLARTIGQGENGKEFTKITLVFRTPYKARKGAIIEREFGSLSARIKQDLVGAIQSSDPKDIEKAKKEACLTYDDVYRYIYKLIVHHQHTPHDGLNGMTPHQKWLEGMPSDVMPIPPLTKKMERLFWRMHHETRPLTQRGFSLFGLHYLPEKLENFERVNSIEGKPAQYSIRYRREDISRIALYRRDGTYAGDAFAKELKTTDGKYQSISLWEWQASRKFYYQTLKDGNGIDTLANFNAQKKLEAQRKAEQKKLSRQYRNTSKSAIQPEIKGDLAGSENGQNQSEPEGSNYLLDFIK